MLLYIRLSLEVLYLSTLLRLKAKQFSIPIFLFWVCFYMFDEHLHLYLKFTIVNCLLDATRLNYRDHQHLHICTSVANSVVEANKGKQKQKEMQLNETQEISFFRGMLAVNKVSNLGTTRTINVFSQL